ncbi:EAL domain-containing protein [Azospirillum sp. sgz301742]
MGLSILDALDHEGDAPSVPVAASVAEAWRGTLAGIEYAFQPIVQMRTGRCYGYEALMRGLDRTPFADANALLDTACAQGVLVEVEAALHAKAIESYCALDGWLSAKLFLNVDARAVGVSPLLWLPVLDRFPGLGVSFEISERKELQPEVGIEQVIEQYRRAHLSVALDDFGVGYAGLKLLYEAKPDYVKVDRFFIDGIGRDVRKRAIANALISYAHALGILTIAEGVETEAEFYACRDLGFDFAQGYLMARPRTAMIELPLSSPVVERLNRTDRRRAAASHQRVYELMERLTPLSVVSPKTALLDYFCASGAPPIAPVVDDHRRPLGLVRERDLKRFVYSRFGGELLRNKGVGGNLADLVIRSPVCDIATPLNQVIEAFSAEEASDGIIIIEAGEYAGFLSSGALIRLVHERNLAMAADQNPLTRLPGNTAIVRHIDSVLEDRDRPHVLVYFDFDNFKPFNDSFGFRQGDRAILMFSERLKALAGAGGAFAGHIGGDDFFLAVSGLDEVEVCGRLAELVALFRSDAESLYDPETRRAGVLVAHDRYGNAREFPLLSVSGVAVAVPAGAQGLTPDAINATIAANKALAKSSPEKLHVVRLG